MPLSHGHSGSTAAFPPVDARSWKGRRIAATAVLLSAAVIVAGGCAISPARRDLAVEWYGVGNAWMDAGKYAEAGKAYDRALALDPGLIAASYNAARALVEAASYDKALPIARKLLAGDPKNVRYITLDAWILWKAGRAKEAAAAYETAFALDPWSEDVVYDSSLLLLESGEAADAKKAVARLEPLVQAKPDEKDDLALYARALGAVGRDDDAISAWENLRSMDGADAAGLEALAALYEKHGSLAKAMDALDAATKKDPKSAQSWFDLARLRLTTADDGKGGLDALGQAIAAGFKDKTAAAALLSSSSLASRDDVAKALAAAGLVDSGGTGLAPAASSAPATQASGTTTPAGASAPGPSSDGAAK